MEHDIVDVTDGLELQKVFDQSNRGQIPTEATLSSAEEKDLLATENDRGSRNLHDIRLNRNYELKGRLNIDSDGLADQNQATRDSVAKVDKIKLAEPAKVGEAAQLESLNVGTPFTAVPASNSSSMPPQPYILKVKNTPARAELDDIYFLCEYFPAIFYRAEIKLFPLSTFSTGASFS